MKIIQYKLLRDFSRELSQEVQDCINEGWQPLGAPFAANESTIVQAMVRYEEVMPPAPLPPRLEGVTQPNWEQIYDQLSTMLKDSRRNSVE